MADKDATPEMIAATLPALKKRLRKAREIQRAGGLSGATISHIQIAARRIADAMLFATSNTEHAAKCCWEARAHLNHVEGA